MPKSFKEWSKDNWQRSDDLKLTNEQISVGCLQRIADATEAMANNYSILISEREKYKRWYHEEVAKRQKLERSVTAHKANYTRLKNKFDAAKIELEISDGLIAGLQKKENRSEEPAENVSEQDSTD